MLRGSWTSVSKGELPSVVVEMLGRVLVDLSHGHRGFEVGIPTRWEVHCTPQSFLGLCVEAAVQGCDDMVELEAHPSSVEY